MLTAWFQVIRALYDFEARSDQELSFQKGDFFHVIGRENDTEWYEACNPVLPDARGLVPVRFFLALEKTVSTTKYPLGQSSTPTPPLPLDIRQFLTPVTATSTSTLQLTSYATQKMMARIDFQGDFVSIVIDTNLTYQSLIDRIGAQVGRFPIARGTLKLRYCDDDGDNVNISNDDDLQLALNEATHRQVNREAFMQGRLGEVYFSCIDC